MPHNENFPSSAGEIKRVSLAESKGKTIVFASSCSWDASVLLIFTDKTFTFIKPAHCKYDDSIEYDEPHFDLVMSGLAGELIDAGIITEEYYDKLRAERAWKSNQEQEAKEREQLARLKHKYEGTPLPAIWNDVGQTNVGGEATS